MVHSLLNTSPLTLTPNVIVLKVPFFTYSKRIFDKILSETEEVETLSLAFFCVCQAEREFFSAFLININFLYTFAVQKKSFTGEESGASKSIE